MFNKRRLLAIALCSLMAGAGCVNNRVYLKNTATGEVVKCGTTHVGPLLALAAQSDEAQCVNDYKEQGYVRVAHP
jgi:hypothetical protein